MSLINFRFSILSYNSHYRKLKKYSGWISNGVKTTPVNQTKNNNSNKKKNKNKKNKTKLLQELLDCKRNIKIILQVYISKELADLIHGTLMLGS